MPEYTKVWLPDFSNLPKEQTDQEKRVEARKQQARLESGIVTANDKQDTQIEANKAKARKEVEQTQKYRQEEAAIQKEGKPLFGNLSPTQQFVAYGTPGYSTIMFADDASKDYRQMKSALKHRQIAPALGHAVKIPADVAMGVVSLFPFTGTAVKGAQSANIYLNGVNKRAQEVLLREGDFLKNDLKNWAGDFSKGRFPNPKEEMFATVKQFGNKNSLNYIFNSKADPNLAYKLPYKYSGQEVLAAGEYETENLAHPGDMIDVIIGKSKVLKDPFGNVIGELSTDLTYVPETDIVNFRTIQPKGQISVLRPVDGYVQFPGKTPYQVIKRHIVPENFSKQISRAENSRIVLKNTNSSPITFVDPGHYGISAWNTPDGMQLIGNDIYHFNTKGFLKTHITNERMQKSPWYQKMIPNVNVGGNPIIVQWPITGYKSGGTLNYLRYFK